MGKVVESEGYARAHILLEKQCDILTFVNQMTKEDDRYSVENFDGTQIVNAKSIIGMIYATSDFNDEMYLVNTDNDGSFPSWVDEYRI